MLSHSIGLGKKLFGGAYKFLSELGPCGWTQGLFFIKNTSFHKKNYPPKSPPDSSGFFRYCLSCHTLSTPKKDLTAPGRGNYRLAVNFLLTYYMLTLEYEQ
jgi:hypothetical protein